MQEKIKHLFKRTLIVKAFAKKAPILGAIIASEDVLKKLQAASSDFLSGHPEGAANELQQAITHAVGAGVNFIGGVSLVGMSTGMIAQTMAQHHAEQIAKQKPPHPKDVENGWYESVVKKAKRASETAMVVKDAVEVVATEAAVAFVKNAPDTLKTIGKTAGNTFAAATSGAARKAGSGLIMAAGKVDALRQQVGKAADSSLTGKLKKPVAASKAAQTVSQERVKAEAVPSATLKTATESVSKAAKKATTKAASKLATKLATELATESVIKSVAKLASKVGTKAASKPATSKPASKAAAKAAPIELVAAAKPARVRKPAVKQEALAAIEPKAKPDTAAKTSRKPTAPEKSKPSSKTRVEAGIPTAEAKPKTSPKTRRKISTPVAEG